MAKQKLVSDFQKAELLNNIKGFFRTVGNKLATPISYRYARVRDAVKNDVEYGFLDGVGQSVKSLFNSPLALAPTEQKHFKDKLEKTAKAHKASLVELETERTQIINALKVCREMMVPFSPKNFLPEDKEEANAAKWMPKIERMSGAVIHGILAPGYEKEAIESFLKKSKEEIERIEKSITLCEKKLKAAKENEPVVQENVLSAEKELQGFNANLNLFKIKEKMGNLHNDYIAPGCTVERKEEIREELQAFFNQQIVGLFNAYSAIQVKIENNERDTTYFNSLVRPEAAVREEKEEPVGQEEQPLLSPINQQTALNERGLTNKWVSLFLGTIALTLKWVTSLMLPALSIAHFWLGWGGALSFLVTMSPIILPCLAGIAAITIFSGAANYRALLEYGIGGSWVKGYSVPAGGNRKAFIGILLCGALAGFAIGSLGLLPFLSIALGAGLGAGLSVLIAGIGYKNGLNCIKELFKGFFEGLKGAFSLGSEPKKDEFFKLFKPGDESKIAYVGKLISGTVGILLLTPLVLFFRGVFAFLRISKDGFTKGFNLGSGKDFNQNLQRVKNVSPFAYLGAFIGLIAGAVFFLVVKLGEAIEKINEYRKQITRENIKLLLGLLILWPLKKIILKSLTPITLIKIVKGAMDRDVRKVAVNLARFVTMSTAITLLSLQAAPIFPVVGITLLVLAAIRFIAKSFPTSRDGDKFKQFQLNPKEKKLQRIFVAVKKAFKKGGFRGEPTIDISSPPACSTIGEIERVVYGISDEEITIKQMQRCLVAGKVNFKKETPASPEGVSQEITPEDKRPSCELSFLDKRNIYHKLKHGLCIEDKEFKVTYNANENNINVIEKKVGDASSPLITVPFS